MFDIYKSCLSFSLYAVVFDTPFYSIDNYFGRILSEFTKAEALDHDSIDRTADTLSFVADGITVEISPHRIYVCTSLFVQEDVYNMLDVEPSGLQLSNEWGMNFTDYSMEVLDEGESCDSLRQEFMVYAAKVFLVLRAVFMEDCPGVHFIGLIEDFLIPRSLNLDILAKFDQCADIFEGANAQDKDATNRYFFQSGGEHNYKRSLEMSVRRPFERLEVPKSYNFIHFDYQHRLNIPQPFVGKIIFDDELNGLSTALRELITSSGALNTVI